MALHSFKAAPRALRGHCFFYLLPWLALLLAGCATPRALDDGGGFGFPENKDAFQLLQDSAGVEPGAQHPLGEELETADVHQLWEALARAPVSLGAFGPRRTLTVLLRELLSADEDMDYALVLQRCQPFKRLVVMRPDGYLTGALTGKPLQRMGRLELREGRLMAGAFEVGAFFLNKGGVFYSVDESLQRSGLNPLGELALERDWLNAALDGAEDALLELVKGLAHLVTEPIRSLEGLRQLPTAVATLIASSPEYFARYSTRPLQEQIREAARLSTHLLTLYGSAGGTVTRFGAAGARVPVLSLTAEGAVAVEQVAVPAGTGAAALGAGAGAVYVLMTGPAPDEGRAAGPVKEPGQWGPAEEHMSERAARYQEQISGHPVKEAYWVGGVGRNSGGVAFDGYKDGVLLECKGPGYANKFLESLDPKYWFRDTGAKAIVKQAQRQLQAAKGVPIRWHVEEASAAEAIRKLFKAADVKGIDVVHTPALP